MRQYTDSDSDETVVTENDYRVCVCVSLFVYSVLKPTEDNNKIKQNGKGKKRKHHNGSFPTTFVCSRCDDRPILLISRCREQHRTLNRLVCSLFIVHIHIHFDWFQFSLCLLSIHHHHVLFDYSFHNILHLFFDCDDHRRLDRWPKVFERTEFLCGKKFRIWTMYDAECRHSQILFELFGALCESDAKL